MYLKVVITSIKNLIFRILSTTMKSVFYGQADAYVNFSTIFTDLYNLIIIRTINLLGIVLDIKIIINYI